MNTDQELAKIINTYAEMVKNGEVTSFAPLLHLLRFENKPLTLKKHFQLEPLFSMQIPKRQCVMCCRQIGKSVSLAAQTLLTSALIPYYHSLVIQPLFSQIRNFSNQIFRPLMVNAYIADNILHITAEERARWNAGTGSGDSPIYIFGSGLQADNTGAVTLKVAEQSNGILVNDEGISLALASDETAGAMAPEQYSKLSNMKDV